MSVQSIVNGFSQPIQHQVEIDEMLLHIAAIDAQVEYYEELKKHRVSVIAAEIERLEANKLQYRTAIREFMAAQGEKTLNYPGVGKVSRKAGSRKWIIKDEAALIAFLEQNSSISPQLLAKVIVTEKSVAKKELNKLLDELQQNNALKTDAVVMEVSEELVVISLDKGENLISSVQDRKSVLLTDAPSPTKPSSVQPTTHNYDELAI